MRSIKAQKGNSLLQRLQAQRGSALLVSLMVIVGLSILGLGFVTLSETEAAISINMRNREQTLSHAEAGAKVVVDWFQNPQWALGKGLMPSNDPTLNAELVNIKKTRTIHAAGYVGKYKPSAASLIFDLPYHPKEEDRLYGTENFPDILIQDTAGNGRTFLNTFNTLLFPDLAEGGRITEIRIYAPPIVGGSVNPEGFIEGGDRYGYATVKVTAEKTVNNNVVARRFVKLVVTEFPFPGPNGPVQSNTTIDVENGSMNVYWGQISARLNIDYKTVGAKPIAVPGLPWVDAYNRVNIEHGWDSSTLWTAGKTYYPGDIVHPSNAVAATNVLFKDHDYKMIDTTPCTNPTVEPGWTVTVGSKYKQAGCGGAFVWQEQAATMYPNLATDTTYNTDSVNWLSEMLGYSFADPFAQGRARGVVVQSGNSNYLAYGSYNTPTDPTGAYYCWFQIQTTDTPPLQKTVVFPFINYDFWKQVAIAGDDGVSAVHYFKYDAPSQMFYRPADPGVKKGFDAWVNSCTGVTGSLGPGFYFFDTKDGKNPQPAPASGTAPNLTDPVSITAQSAKPCFCMKGFIFLNASDFETQGSPKGETKLYNYPGEPFRDVGYREVDPATGLFVRDALGNLAKLKGGSNQIWDYQEMNGNGSFDVVLRDLRKDSQGNAIPGVVRPDGSALPAQAVVPIQYYEGCTVGTNCSEPHEPYFNMIYPASGTASVASPPPNVIKLGWEPQASQTRLALEPLDTATYLAPIDCSNAANKLNCTSNRHDEKGPLTQLSPILQGVFYNEGTYTPKGNAEFYGSLLIQGQVGNGGTGSPIVYFDESLVKGDFKKKFKDFPRVYVSAHQTDEQ